MKEKFLSWGTLLCLAVLTCLLLVHALAIFPGVPAMRWFFVTSAVVLGRLDAPAWVQAIFSIVAIFTAIGIAMWQRHSEKQIAQRTSRATVMIIGAAIDSRLLMLIATTKAMLHELDHPSHPSAAGRARFGQTLFEKVKFPREEQMLLLGQAIPDVAADMANGVAAVERVLVSFDYVVSSPSLTTLSEPEILANYLGCRQNLVTALHFLTKAKSEMVKFATAK